MSQDVLEVQKMLLDKVGYAVHLPKIPGSGDALVGPWWYISKLTSVCTGLCTCMRQRHTSKSAKSGPPETVRNTVAWALLLDYSHGSEFVSFWPSNDGRRGTVKQ